MAAEDFVSDKQFDKNADLEDSPPRPTVGHADKFNAEQFQGIVGGGGRRSVIPAREYEPGYDAEREMQDWMNDLRSKRHPHYVGDQTLADYRANGPAETTTKEVA